MIVLDTSVLVYAVGQDHPLRDPSRRLVDRIMRGRLHATTIAEVIQETAHVRSRRYGRRDAAAVARDYATLLDPLLVLDASHVAAALTLFERHESLDAFDALLAAAAVAAEADALVSADRAFASVPKLRHVSPGTAEFGRLVGD